MTFESIVDLSDPELIARTKHTAAAERQTTAELVALLAELDSRRLYLAEGFSSLFTYCTQVLRLSEAAAYGRITAARAARRCPRLLTLLATGDITLTTVGLVAPHLTNENQDALLQATQHKSKREVERLVASLVAPPDIPTSVRKLPEAAVRGSAVLATDVTTTTAPSLSLIPTAVRVDTRPMATRSVVVPLAPKRYLIRVTVSEETHTKLERAESLLRHICQYGDVAFVLDRALTLLVNDLERTRLAMTRRPKAGVKATQPRVASRARGRKARSLDSGRRPMRLCRPRRPMSRDQLPGVSSRRAVCERWSDDRGEPSTPVPSA